MTQATEATLSLDARSVASVDIAEDRLFCQRGERASLVSAPDVRLGTREFGAVGRERSVDANAFHDASGGDREA